MSALQPTPETDEAWAKWPYAGPGVHANFARKLERQRNSAKQLNRNLLDQLEAQAAQLEAMRQEREQWRMSSVCREKDAQIETMREAIKEAHRFIRDIVKNHECGDDTDASGEAALAKLHPFLKP